jgi:hypothetical protein
MVNTCQFIMFAKALRKLILIIKITILVDTAYIKLKLNFLFQNHEIY